jgi:hypothetical protein
LNFSTLACIAKELNMNKISWVVGASVMLHFHGLVDCPHDIDILVDEKDIDKAKSVLDNLGTVIYDGSNVIKEPYLTKHFYTYEIKDVEADVMSGFILSHCNGQYELFFDSDTITSYAEIDDVSIPLSSPEDWYVLYQLMINREPKVKLIENYLMENGVKNKHLLERALNQSLPDAVKERVTKLLNSVK